MNARYLHATQPVERARRLRLEPYSGLFQFLIKYCQNKTPPKKAVFLSHKLSTNGDLSLA